MYAGRTAVRYLKTLAAMTVGGHHPVAYVESQAWIDRDLVLASINKSAVPESDLTGGFSQTPADADFSEALRPVAVLDRLGGRQVPMYMRLLTGGATAARAYWIGRGKAIPLSRVEMTGDAMLPRQVGAITVSPNQILDDQSPLGEQLLKTDLINAAAQALDGALLDPLNAGDDYIPASITDGITPLASTGTTLSAIDHDLRAMLDELIAAGSNLAGAKWLMSPTTAVYLALLRGTGGDLAYPNVTANGGTIAGLSVVVTANVPDSGSPAQRSIVLVDTNDFVWSDGGIAIRKSTQATIEMSDAPTGNTVTPTAMSSYQVSLFQEEATAFKIVRAVNWRMRRPTISLLDGVSY